MKRTDFITLNQTDARALTDAGYMPITEYLRLCRENGWQSEAAVRSVDGTHSKLRSPPA